MDPTCFSIWIDRRLIHDGNWPRSAADAAVLRSLPQGVTESTGLE